MEPNESHHQQQQHLSSPYYHHHHHQQQQQHPLHLHHPIPTTASASTAASSAAAVPPSSNVLFPPPNDGSSRVVYPHSVPSSAVTTPMELTKRKRGRPRKYGTPEQALAVKKMSSSASSLSAKERREQAAPAGGAASSNSGMSRKSQLGKTGQSFTPHIVNIAPGEDVAQKIVLFAQQSKHELCVLSASGTISNASLSQPASSSNVSYEGQYEIVSLCGSYIRAELGNKTGGLSVCLCSSNGQVIGGGVGGHLTAAGPVQVILGTFQFNRKKDTESSVKGEDSSSRGRGLPPSPAGGNTSSMLGIDFWSGMESLGRNPLRGNDEHHHHHHHFMIQTPQGMHHPSEWGTGSSHEGRSSAGYDLSGRRTGQESSENGEYEEMGE